MVRQNQLQCLDVTSRAGMTAFFFFARYCLDQVSGGELFSQRSELATACTSSSDRHDARGETELQPDFHALVPSYDLLN